MASPHLRRTKNRVERENNIFYSFLSNNSATMSVFVTICFLIIIHKGSFSGVSLGCHTHLLERHVSKSTLFA